MAATICARTQLILSASQPRGNCKSVLPAPKVVTSKAAAAALIPSPAADAGNREIAEVSINPQTNAPANAVGKIVNNTKNPSPSLDFFVVAGRASHCNAAERGTSASASTPAHIANGAAPSMPVATSIPGPTAIPSPINVSCAPIARPRQRSPAICKIHRSQTIQRKISPKPAAKLNANKIQKSLAAAIPATETMLATIASAPARTSPRLVIRRGTKRDTAKIINHGAAAKTPICAAGIPRFCKISASNGGRIPNCAICASVDSVQTNASPCQRTRPDEKLFMRCICLLYTHENKKKPHLKFTGTFYDTLIALL